MTHGLIDPREPLISDEKAIAVATLVSATGSTSKKVGTKMIVGESGRLLGGVTIGGCAIDPQIEGNAQFLRPLIFLNELKTSLCRFIGIEEVE